MVALQNKYIIRTLVTAFAVTTFFSCSEDFKEIQNLSKSSFEPQTEADSINLKYTDSGKVKAILISEKMLDFSNAKFGFTEFPKGINLTVFDGNNKENYVTSKYAKSYTKNGLVELLDSVVITTNDGKKLFTDQLFYDQKSDWLYTDKYFKLKDENGNFIDGPGIDLSKDFKIFNAQRNSGTYKNSNTSDI